jgi:hypothetical protein
VLGTHNVVFAVRLAAESLAENMRLHRILHPAAPVGHLDQQLLVTVRNVEFYRRGDRGVEVASTALSSRLPIMDISSVSLSVAGMRVSWQAGSNSSSMPFSRALTYFPSSSPHSAGEENGRRQSPARAARLRTAPECNGSPRHSVSSAVSPTSVAVQFSCSWRIMRRLSA